MSIMPRAATQSASAGSLTGLARRFAGFVDALIVYFHRRATIKALRELDDRELRDIGLLRCHIEAAVKGEANLELWRLR